MRLAPWQVKGIDPEARDTAREAARRSGVSVGQWLNSVILEQAADEGIAPAFDDAGTHGEDLAAINERLDGLSRQLALLSGHRPAGPANDGDASHQIADAILRLNGRLDQLIAEGRTASNAFERRVNSVDRALANLNQERLRGAYVGGEPAAHSRAEPGGVDQAIAEITARQRALDGEFAAPPPPALQRSSYSAAYGGSPGPTALQCRADDAVAGLRKDLADIGRALSEAMPRNAVEALEGEVRALVGRLDAGRQSGVDAPALAGLEQGLREVRDALRGLAPAESLVGFDQAVQTLSSKIDMIAAGRQDPAGLEQLEAAIASLRGVVGQVASGDALAALAHEVRGLADKIERGAPASGGADILATLEHRIGSIADAIESVRAQGGRGVSSNLDQLVKSLNDKLEAMQSSPRGDPLSRGDQLALGGLEDRIAKLVEKLDASEGRLGHLGAIERGMAELLVHLEGLRANPAGPMARPGRMEANPLVAAAPVEVIRRTQDSLEAVQGTIETVVDRIATIETNLRKDQRDGAPAPVAPASPPVQPAAASAASATPRSAPPAKPAGGARPSLDPSLPHDHPLEPGSGPPRARPPARNLSHVSADAADRVAASEAPLRAAKGAAKGAEKGAGDEPEPKSGYLQAARRAAQYAAQNAQRGEVAAAVAADPDTLGSKLSQRLKALFVGISVVVLIVVALRFAANYFESAELALPQAPALAERDAPADRNTPSPLVVARPAAPRPQAPPLSISPPAEQATPPLNPVVPPAAAVNPLLSANPFFSAMPPAGVVGTDKPPRSPLMPAPPAPVASADTGSDVTGSVSAARPVTPVPRSAPTAPPVPPAAAGADQLPATIGGKMLIASAGEPAVAYEIATRYAEGRGVPQNFQEAAVWYERAAKGGLAPALFRLGALYEKGNGVAKDLNEARRLYLAAADKGNANAMHNIGVLYAEGIDGKPDFKSAAQWFRKSASFGIADSQYNLAVLYARGIGVERNLAEAYQWFALAAKGGDPEAGKKRDELAARLDQKALAAARSAAETWVAQQPSEDAATVKPPTGGWDQAEPAAKRRPRPHVQARPAAAPL